MFASRTLPEHLLRGIVGIGLFIGAMLALPTYPLLSILGAALGMLALRGCPMCWLCGLFETLAASATGRRDKKAQACLDGRCAFDDERVT